MEGLKEKIYTEMDKLEGEIDRASSDGNSDLATLEGWNYALKWVLKQIEGEGE